MGSRLLLVLLASCLPFGTVAAISGSAWTPIGPAPIGKLFGGVSGRASAIAVNPLNGNQIWLGTASGGIWFSSDAGQTWVPISDRVEALAIGDLEVGNCTPTGCARVFAGTGENAIRRDTYHGRGLLAGIQVTNPPSISYAWTLHDGKADGYDFERGSINDVLRVPGTGGNSTGLFITLSSGVTASSSEATVTAPEPIPGAYGLYRSFDAGAHWTRLVVPGAEGYKPTDLEMDPLDPDVLWIGFLGRGIFRTTDGGATWCPMSEGIPKPNGCPATGGLPADPMLAFDHVELAVHHAVPRVPATLYATLGHCFDFPLIGRCTPSVYRSLDGGPHWSLRRPGGPDGGAYGDCVQGYSLYTHLLAVDPVDPDALFAGGIRLCRSINGGQNFFPADYNSDPGINGVQGTIPDPIIHPDHHELVFHPQNPNRLYSTSDGGFAVTDLYGIAALLPWTHSDQDLQITGFQSVDSSPLTTAVIGAAQDNGGMRWGGTDQWTYLPCCGDGGFARIDEADPDILYVGSEPHFKPGHIQRSLDGGSHFCNVDSGVDTDDPSSFYVPFEQSPVPPHPLYRGTHRLYRSRATGPSQDPCRDLAWDKVSPVFSTSPQPEIVSGVNVITAIGLGTSHPERVYVGLYGGEVWTTQSISTFPPDWSWADVSAGLPSAPVTRIAVDPTNDQVAYVSLSGFGPEAKIWKTTSGGASWSAAASQLPIGVPVNTISIEPGNPDTLWAGLDGNATMSTVFRSLDGGTTWAPLANGLPNVPVYEIALDPTRNRAFAGTHGRGAWVFGHSLLYPYREWREMHFFENPLFGRGFPPDQPCTLDLILPDGTSCAAGSVDALGGTIHTDREGVLVSSRQGTWSEKPAVWGCFGGECLGGTSTTACEPAGQHVSQVRVTCGGETTAAAIAGFEAASPLSSTELMVQPPKAAGAGPASARSRTAQAPGAPAEGRFTLSATLADGSGTPRSLCTVAVPLAPGETAGSVLRRAEPAVNGSPTCAASGVRAVFDEDPGGETEDDWGRAPSLRLESSLLAGAQLITALHAGPGEADGACLAVDDLGRPMRGEGQTLALRLLTGAGGAAGGTLTLTQDHMLGRCSIVVETAPGQTGAELASAIVSTLQDSLPDPGCSERHNLRSLRLAGDTVEIVFASSVRVCLDDPLVAFSLRPAGLPNLHPAPVLQTSPTLECAGPGGATVLLDGGASTDPDSTPGSNDDIVRFEWFEQESPGSEVFLGTGVALSVLLPLGPHTIILRVTDRQGLTGEATAVVSVVDTVPPTMLIGVDPPRLWPPNHRMVEAGASVLAADDCGPATVTLVSVSSSEPDDAPGADDGATVDDVQQAQIGTADLAVLLRAERDRRGTGRTYAIVYSAVDSSGNSAQAQGVFDVPLDVDGVVEPLILAVGANAAGTFLDWTPVPGARHYNVIRSERRRLQEIAGAFDLGPVLCIEAASLDASTLGNEDLVAPALGEAFLYFVEYDDGRRSGYGTETAPKPRLPATGDCP